MDPALPPELERVVFDLAAWRDKEVMCTLVLVARRVHVWIGPLRYRVRLGLWQLIGHCPASRIHTRHLAVCGPWLHTGGDHRDAAASSIPRILRAFPHLVSLRLWTITAASIADLRLFLALPALRRLAINLEAVFSERAAGPDPPPAPLAHVTHLELFQVRGTPLALPRLAAAFPALTHIALFYGDVPNLNRMRHALLCWPALVVLVHVLDGAFAQEPNEAEQALHAKRAAELTAIDPRLVILRLEHSGERDWEHGAWGGRDYWCRAEEIVAARGLLTSN
ncbi:hypothetical protein MIND_00584200 [Mycena indigotica]|uniref:Uncharacterized protein n=1 Tax=Mycena indigotica TaxID=2126181 RepID=A0A8H6W8W2_9AGAR|nr:uncharacterized protein MIND_00584200 [Mycena indigotica]KAF7303549.1 hypothetical protein MIND_00584200 [Mycena indigotica]